MSDERKARVLELIQELNDLGEDERVEAKKASEVGKSVLETICAFSNEPGLGGGSILLGVARNVSGDLFEPPKYEVVGVPDPEKIADDLASQCASGFNRALRPRIEPTLIGSKSVILVTVTEVSPGEKPIFLRKYGLPEGAFRRIGATDQRCTDDDIQILYDARRRTPYDADVVSDAELSDLDPDAVEEYRRLRREVAPEAEELQYGDEDLMLALNCVRRVSGELQPTVSGILLFGTTIALRRFFGMMRVDYIRVPGREWVPHPEDRYSSVEIRAPLIRAVRRAEAAVLDDLPKAFRLPEGSLHREDVPPLPRAVLREAIVNAVMHRDYHVHGPVQIIRYTNRIEISNPGFSLKSPERLGEPGSETRNPNIASVFHETRLAENKGTGVRAMRRLMKEAELVPPSFESDRGDNRFAARFVLHHFLSDDDLAWLNSLGESSLNPEEKLVLVWVKEVGAVDNATYRDLTGAETLRASAGLRHLCDLELLEKKGQGSATYYVPATRLQLSLGPGARLDREEAKARMVPGQPSMVPGKPSMPARKPGMAEEESSRHATGAREQAYRALPQHLQIVVDGIGAHADENSMRLAIQRLCAWQPHTAEALGALLRRNSDYLKTRYLKPMVSEGALRLTIPEMPKHPNQAYVTAEELR